jgi:cell division control protein 24
LSLPTNSCSALHSVSPPPSSTPLPDTMATVAGRKKSIVSSAGLQIDAPVANNTLLNKSASQSTSLYQDCSSLRSRLMRIRGFSYYFSLLASSEDARLSTDPVTQLWDLFSFGIPLCYIFDQLPAEEGFAKINNSQFNQEEYDANPDKPKKRAIALFAMQIRTDRVMHSIPGCELFTVTDLWDRNSTDGLVKVRFYLKLSSSHRPHVEPPGYQHRNRNCKASTPRCFRSITALTIRHLITRLP